MEGSSPTPEAPASGRPARRNDGPDPGPRVVFHVDMDAFFAAIEARDDPSLRLRPLVVGADPKGGRGRGVVCTASYEARKFGVRSAMPISQAWSLCPHAAYVRPDFARYKAASELVMKTLARYADLLEVAGLDEAYLDVTARCTPEGRAQPDWALAASLARSLQAAVKRATGLSCSVGAAPNKSLAKVASDRRKPHGVTCVAPDEVDAFLAPLPVRALHGCGPKAASTLREAGHATVGELAAAPRGEIEALLGSQGAWLWAVAHGRDGRPVAPDRSARKSRGNERTFPTDERDAAVVQDAAMSLAQELLEDTRRDGRAFATVTVKLRYQGFLTVTRSRSAAVPREPGDKAAEAGVLSDVRRLLEPLLDGRPVRLVGVRLSGFAPAAGQRALLAFGLLQATSPGVSHRSLGVPQIALRAPAVAGFHGLSQLSLAAACLPAPTGSPARGSSTA